MSKDPISDLAAVTLAKYEEENQPPYPGQAAVVAACDLFKAEALRKAQGMPSFLDCSLPAGDK